MRTIDDIKSNPFKDEILSLIKEQQQEDTYVYVHEHSERTIT